MNFIEFQKQMAPFLPFSIDDARMLDPRFDRRRLHEWCAKGYIRPLARGWYSFTDLELDEAAFDRIANRMYAPSYVSLETIMSRAGLVPETVKTVTSITTRKTRTIRTELSGFIYRTVKPALFFGYTLGPHGVKTALPEKAILDYLYLHTDLRTKEDFESIRIDRKALDENIDRSRLDELLMQFNSKTLQQRVESFFKWVRYA